jgi:isochorismate pyruvate lyase
MDLKNPKDCQSLEEVRNEIDKIDEYIISLFSERHKYVEEIVRFKNDKDAIIAQERKYQVILQRKNWAAANGLNANTFEKMYTLIVESNIEHELEILKSKKNNKNV